MNQTLIEQKLNHYHRRLSNDWKIMKAKEMLKVIKAKESNHGS